MMRKKICLLGAPSVGKTSLVRRYVDSLFDERYQQTIGVKIDKKPVDLDGRPVTLLLWDIHGEEEGTPVRDAYLRGLDGYLLVVDGSRPSTVAMAMRVRARVSQLHEGRPYVLALNKSDLVENREAVEAATAELANGAEQVVWTSARSGNEVERCFSILAATLVGA